MGSRTFLVEPDPGGHRFEAVRNVAAVAARAGDVVLLTSGGAQETEAFAVHLADTGVEVRTPFASTKPSTPEMARVVAEVVGAADTVVLMDADQALKRWWYDARRAFRAGTRPQRIVFMLTRYPTRLPLWGDVSSWRRKFPKTALVLLARATGTLDRAAGFTGRDDTRGGRVVMRARDPAVCRAHSRDRAALRTALDLPADRRLVGVFGGVNVRKNVPLIAAAVAHAGLDVDLLLAGPFDDEVRAWVAALPEAERARVHARDGFWPTEVLDQYVACSDAIPLVMDYNGPSGIMGKALAAGVPVVTAGSVVRAREVAATGNGLACGFDAAGIGAALAEVLAAPGPWPRSGAAGVVPPATAEEFACSVLGVDAEGRVRVGTSRRRRR